MSVLGKDCRITAAGRPACLPVGIYGFYRSSPKVCACRGGTIRIPGVLYTATCPALVPRLAWQAGCEASCTAAELGLQLKELDKQLLWEGQPHLQATARDEFLWVLTCSRCTFDRRVQQGTSVLWACPG